MSARTGSMSTDGHGCLTEVAKMVQKIVKILLSSYVEELSLFLTQEGAFA